MGIQSSINSLMSQAQMLATFYKGFDKADKIIKDTTATKNEAKIQTEIAAGNAPKTPEGKVDPEWLKKQREEFDNSKIGKLQKQIFQNEINRNNDPSLADLLAKYGNENPVDSAIEAQSANSKLKNEIASDLARASVEARTASINKTKSNFDEHTASLIKYYSKGSGNP